MTPVILAAASVFIHLLVVVVSMKLSEFRYTRSALIGAAPAVLFEQINDLRKFQTWNPWAKIDQECKTIFAGPSTGVGSSFTWVGNKNVGEGTMTIIESRPEELVRCRMEFRKPMQATNVAEFAFKPDGNKTLMTWAMSGTNGFFGKAFGLVVNCDKMVGGQFEKGLESLRDIAETQTKA